MQLQLAAFGYFVQNVNPSSGLVADISRDNSSVSNAVIGFALSSYPVAVERGRMERGNAVQLCLAALRFFRDSDQNGSMAATGFKGFYYHFLDINTDARVRQSELSMIDTALLIAGVLIAALYFTADTPEEIELWKVSDDLYRRIDWLWAHHRGDKIHVRERTGQILGVLIVARHAGDTINEITLAMMADIGLGTLAKGRRGLPARAPNPENLGTATFVMTFHLPLNPVRERVTG